MAWHSSWNAEVSNIMYFRPLDLTVSKQYLGVLERAEDGRHCELATCLPWCKDEVAIGNDTHKSHQS